MGLTLSVLEVLMVRRVLTVLVLKVLLVRTVLACFGAIGCLPPFA